jgi:endoglucanase
MKVHTLLLAILLTILQQLTNAQGFLRTDGQKIINENGENVLLRGMGLGGWMLQEGYMLRVNKDGQQYKIKERIIDLIGKSDTEMFYDLWLQNHTRKIDIDSMKAWGFNSVRLPMHYNLYTPPIESEPVGGKNTWLEKGFALTDSLLAWCKANQMYLILDLHAAPGGQGNDLNISDRDPSKPFLWENKANQEKTIALWKKLAERYADEPWIGAYDLLNEPNYGFENPAADPNGLSEQKNEPLRKLLMEITQAIREVDHKHIIIIEGNGWGNNYRGMLPVWDKNIVLSFHKYWNNNDQASIKNMLDTRSQQNIPIWLGETGENSNVWFTSCIELLERNNIGWAMWPLKKLGNNNPLEVKTNPDYQNILHYWEGKGSKPEKTTAKNGLMKLAEDLKLEYNIFHKDVIDAMFRQTQSSATLPYKKHKIKTVINAVDYDLGRINKAYYDTDSANYRVVKGQQGGNRGRIYRNDGVDINEDSLNIGSYYISNIEPGEWLQYSIDFEKAGTYNIEFTYRPLKPAAVINIEVNGQHAGTTTLLSGIDESSWQRKKITFKAAKGLNKIKINFPAGGLDFKSFKL